MHLTANYALQQTFDPAAPFAAAKGTPASNAAELWRQASFAVTRQMSPEREREYAELHAYLDYYSTHVLGIDPDDPVHPTNVGKRIVAEHGRSKALDGLKQAVNDTVEDLSERSPDFVQALDAALHKRGLISCSEVRRRYASSYQRIMKRGKINTEVEYYLVAGILADDSFAASRDERAQLEQMAAQYAGNA